MKRIIILILSVMLPAININAQNSDFVEIIKSASKAPSGHNTQPWRFRISGDTITIMPHLADALPVVDGNHRELFISLGCAVENLCIAATYFGYCPQVAAEGKQGIMVTLTQSDHKDENPLFGQIEKRQTNRSVYSDRKIPEDTLSMLQSTLSEDGVHFYFAEIGTPFADTLTQYVVRGNEIQMQDKEFKRELVHWMRLNNRQIHETNNGLTYQALGIPSLPGLLSKPLVSMFMKAGKQNKSDLKKINSSSHLVLMTTEHNDPKGWIDLGRTLQRFLLNMTGAGIANAYMNQPCEVAPLAREIQQLLPINGEFPMLILRIGYADPMPYSPRKDVESIID